jgi:hypothetical protein
MATASVSADSIRRLVEKGKATRPELATRLEKAAMIVLFRTVEVTDGGRHEYRVESDTTPGRFYRVNGTCDCQDYSHRAPSGFCKHRLAVALVERVQDDAERATRTAIEAEWADALARRY